MNHEPTKRTPQALPGRRQFLSALGTGAGLACAAGRPLPSLGAITRRLVAGDRFVP